MHPAIAHELMQARTADLHRQADRERTARAASRHRHTQREERPPNFAPGRTATMLLHRMLSSAQRG
jgi:hypothetical protein